MNEDSPKQGPMHEGVANSLFEETIFASPDIIDGRRVLLRAERLAPSTRRVQGRRAIITRRAVSERKALEVDVLREELVVEYVDGDGSVMADEGQETIVVLLREEEVEIVKHVRAVEEIRISKRRVVEEQRLTDTVRHETLDIVDHLS